MSNLLSGFNEDNKSYDDLTLDERERLNFCIFSFVPGANDIYRKLIANRKKQQVQYLNMSWINVQQEVSHILECVSVDVIEEVDDYQYDDRGMSYYYDERIHNSRMQDFLCNENNEVVIDDENVWCPMHNKRCFIVHYPVNLPTITYCFENEQHYERSKADIEHDLEEKYVNMGAGALVLQNALTKPVFQVLALSAAFVDVGPRCQPRIMQVKLIDTNYNVVVSMTCHQDHVTNYKTSQTGLTYQNAKPDVNERVLRQRLKLACQGKVIVLYDRSLYRDLELDATMVIDLRETFDCLRELSIYEAYAYTFLTAVMSTTTISIARMILRLFKVYSLTTLQHIALDWYREHPVLKVAENGEFNLMFTTSSRFVFTQDYLFAEPIEYNVKELLDQTSLVALCRAKKKKMRNEKRKDVRRSAFSVQGDDVFSYYYLDDRDEDYVACRAKEYGLDVIFESRGKSRAIRVKGQLKQVNAFGTYMMYGRDARE